MQPRELVRHAIAQPPVFAPGTGWSYSNTNYVLLGMIISRVDHLPKQYAPVWEIYRRLIAPLGLTHTSFPVTDPGIAGPHPRGYIIDPPTDYHLPGTRQVVLLANRESDTNTDQNQQDLSTALFTAFCG